MASKAEPFLTLGFAAISWIEHYLIHGPGDVQGQPIELDDEFAAFVVKGYQVDTLGRRKVRRAFISRAKGRAKSELAAMIACFEALGPCRFDHFAEAGEVSDWGYEYDEGEPVGTPMTYVEILNVATEESQAGNTYDNVHYMLGEDTCSPDLLADYGRIDVGLTRINLPNKRGFMEPVTSADSSKDGGKSTFIVADETHLWVLPRLKRLHSVMTRNLLKRKAASGWMLETSTMYGEGESSVAEGTHSYALRVASGRENDRTLLFDHKQAADHWDPEQRDQRIKALHEAYGPAAEWMNLEAIADSWDDPQTTEADFRRYWLNQPVPLEEAPTGAIDLVQWAALKGDASPPERAVLTVQVASDRRRSSIGVVGESSGRTLLVVESKPGTGWLEERIMDLVAKRTIAEVALLPASLAGGVLMSTLPQKLAAEGVEFHSLTTTEIAQGCIGFQEAVKVGPAAPLAPLHVSQPDLDSSVASTRTKVRGEGETWDLSDPGSAVLVAVANGLHRWRAAAAGPSVYESREMVIL